MLSGVALRVLLCRGASARTFGGQREDSGTINLLSTWEFFGRCDVGDSWMRFNSSRRGAAYQGHCAISGSGSSCRLKTSSSPSDTVREAD